MACKYLADKIQHKKTLTLEKSIKKYHFQKYKFKHCSECKIVKNSNGT